MKDNNTTIINYPKVWVNISALGELPCREATLTLTLNTPASVTVSVAAGDVSGNGTLLTISSLTEIVKKLQQLINTDPESNMLSMSLYSKDFSVSAKFIIVAVYMSGDASNGSLDVTILARHKDALADGIIFNIYDMVYRPSTVQPDYANIDPLASRAFETSNESSSIASIIKAVGDTAINKINIEDLRQIGMSDAQMQIIRDQNSANRQNWKYLSNILENSSQTTDFLNGQVELDTSRQLAVYDSITKSLIKSGSGGFTTILNQISSDFLLQYIPSLSDAGKFINQIWDIDTVQGEISCTTARVNYNLGEASYGIAPIQYVASWADMTFLPSAPQENQITSTWARYPESSGNGPKNGRVVVLRAPACFTVLNVQYGDISSNNANPLNESQRQNQENVLNDQNEKMAKSFAQSQEKAETILRNISEIRYNQLLYAPSTANVLGLPANIDVENYLGQIVDVKSDPGGKMFKGMLTSVEYRFSSSGVVFMNLTFAYVRI